MNWQDTLTAANALRDELKSRERVFQCESKEAAADLWGQPLNTYYHYSFLEWSYVSGRLSEYYDCMGRDVDLVSEWSGTDLRPVAFGRWVDVYQEWLKVNGH